MILVKIFTYNKFIGHIIFFILLIFSVQGYSQTEFPTGAPVHLDTNINSKYDDYAPVIAPDGKGLFFIRKYHPENTGGIEDGADIWYSPHLKDDGWFKAIKFGKPLNTNGLDYVASVTPDGNTLLVGNKYKTDGTKSDGVSITHRTVSGWSYPELVVVPNYKNIGKYKNEYLCNDGKTLLLAYTKTDSKTGQDIFVCFKKGEEWTEPLNLGPVVNCEKDDHYPFLAADGVSLYFSSYGHDTYGSSDVFVSRRLDNTWTNWSKPENLGTTINTKDWEAGYFIDAAGEYAYFGESVKGRMTDIFRVLLPQKVKPKPVVLISGKVLNSKTKEPISANISYEHLPDGKEVGIARTNPANGTYKIVLPAGNNFGFHATASKFLTTHDNIDLSNLTEYKEITRDLYLTPIEIGETMRINNIFFQQSKAELLPESHPELDRLTSLLKENANINIEISGHTDNRGGDQADLVLSENRAKSVGNYLIAKGILTNRILTKGYGKTKPIVSNDTEEGRKQNRRVEIKILKL